LFASQRNAVRHSALCILSGGQRLHQTKGRIIGLIIESGHNLFRARPGADNVAPLISKSMHVFYSASFAYPCHCVLLEGYGSCDSCLVVSDESRAADRRAATGLPQSKLWFAILLSRTTTRSKIDKSKVHSNFGGLPELGAAS
jgi:hypothetical protein